MEYQLPIKSQILCLKRLNRVVFNENYSSAKFEMQNMHNRKLISGPFEMYFGHTVSGSLRSKILVNDSLRLV